MQRDLSNILIGWTGSGRGDLTQRGGASKDSPALSFVDCIVTVLQKVHANYNSALSLVKF